MVLRLFALLFALYAIAAAANDLDAVFKRLEQLERKEKAHLATIAELKQELKEQCQGFKQELTLVKQRITDLENISRQKDERIETLANRVSFLEEDVFQKSFLIDKQVQYLTDEPLGAFGVNANESEVVNKSSVNQGTRKKEENGSRQNNNGGVQRRVAINPENPVAFHALIDGGDITGLGIGQNIVFDRVLLNLGNCYHEQHGVFIAPVQGLYLFSVSILSHSHTDQIDVQLVKDGIGLGRVYAYDQVRRSQGSVTVVAQLNAQDEVWTEVSYGDSLWGGPQSSFTGVLLF